MATLWGCGPCKADSAIPWSAGCSPPNLSVAVLAPMCETMVQWNVLWMTDQLAAGLDAPLLSEAGVRYQREGDKNGFENGWLSVPWILKRKRFDPLTRRFYRFADCKALAAWRAAELRVLGDPNAMAYPIQAGPRLFHVVVVHGSGLVEDPSAEYGMKGAG